FTLHFKKSTLKAYLYGTYRTHLKEECDTALDKRNFFKK
ncbi:hypothetical protein AVEN_157884-1, partial [Araneus ventricosus]